MYFDGFDTQLLAVHGEAYARDLERTMAAARRGSGVAATRRWIGARLVDLGTTLAADPALGREVRTVTADPSGC